MSMGRDPSERGSSASYASTPSASGALPTARGAGPSPLASSVLRSTPGAPSTVSWEPPTEGVPPDRSSQRRLAATAPDASRSSSNRLARTTNDYEVENSRASVAVSSKRLLERTVKSDEPLSSLAQQANRGPVTASRTKGRSALFVVLILMALLVVGGVCGALLYWRHHV